MKRSGMEITSTALLDDWQVKYLQLAEECLRDGVRAYINEYDGHEGVDQLKYLLGNTQWWDWLPIEASKRQ